MRKIAQIALILIPLFSAKSALSECLVKNCVTCLDAHTCGVCSQGYKKETKSTPDGKKFDICSKSPTSWLWYLLWIFGLLALMLIPLLLYFLHLRKKKKKPTEAQSPKKNKRRKNHQNKNDVDLRDEHEYHHEPNKKNKKKKILRGAGEDHHGSSPEEDDEEVPSSRRELKDYHHHHDYHPKGIIKSQKKTPKKKVRFKPNSSLEQSHRSQEISPRGYHPRNRLESAKIDTKTPEKPRRKFSRNYHGSKSPYRRNSPYRPSPFKNPVRTPYKENHPPPYNHIPHPTFPIPVSPSPLIRKTPQKGPPIHYNIPPTHLNEPQIFGNEPQVFANDPKRVVLARYQTEVFPNAINVGHQHQISPNYNHVTPIKVTSENNIQIPVNFHHQVSPIQPQYIHSTHTNQGTPFAQSPVREVSRVISGNYYGPRVVGNGPEISPEGMHHQVVKNIFNQPYQQQGAFRQNFPMGEEYIKGENSPSPNRDVSQIVARKATGQPKIIPPRKIATKRVLGDSGNFKHLPPGEVYRGKTNQLSTNKKRIEKNYNCPVKKIRKRKKIKKIHNEPKLEESEIQEDFEPEDPKPKKNKPIPRKSVVLHPKPKYRQLDTLSRKDIMKGSLLNKVLNDSSVPSSMRNSIKNERDLVSVNSSKIANDGANYNQFPIETKVMRVKTSHPTRQDITLYPINIPKKYSEFADHDLVKTDKNGKNGKEEIFYIEEEERNGKKVRVLRVFQNGKKIEESGYEKYYKVKFDEVNKENKGFNQKFDLSELDGSFITDKGSDLMLYNSPELTASENQTIFNNKFESSKRPQMLKNTQKLLQKKPPRIGGQNRYVKRNGHEKSPNFGRGRQGQESSIFDGSYDDLGLYTSPVSGSLNTSFSGNNNNLPLIAEETFEEDDENSEYVDDRRGVKVRKYKNKVMRGMR